MRTINYGCPLEKAVGEALDHAGVEFVHESEDDVRCRRLDFYLPRYGVRVEVKRFATDRSAEQLKWADDVILLQGPLAVAFFCGIFDALCETVEEDTVKEGQKS